MDENLEIQLYASSRVNENLPQSEETGAGTGSIKIGIDTDGIADETEGEEIGISSRGVTTVGFCIARL